MKAEQMKMYSTLKNALTRSLVRDYKTNRVLNPKQLEKSGLEVIDYHSDELVDIKVYEDGSVVYNVHYHNEKARCTVFDIRKAEYYVSPDGFGFKYDLSNLDALIAITSFGDERLIHNSQAVETKYVASVDNDLVQGIKAEIRENQEYAQDILDIIIKIESKNERDLLCQKLLELIPTLKKSQQEVLHMYYFENLTENEISERLHIPRTTIQYRRDSARKALEKKIGL